MVKVKRTGQAIYGRNFASEMYGKTGYNRNVQLVLQHTMLQNEMKSDIARFNDHERNVATLYCWKTGSYVVGKTRDIAIIIYLVLQQCCKTSCTFFVPSLQSFRAKQGIFGKRHLRFSSFSVPHIFSRE